MIKKKVLDSSKVERTIIQQMILNTDFLSRISKVFEPNCLKMNYVNTLAEICIDYYKEYKKAPGKNIQTLYDNIVRIDPDSKELIKTFLISINNEIQNTPEDKLHNTEFYLQEATNHLTHLRHMRFKEDHDNAIAEKNYVRAEALMKGFKSVSHQIKKSRDALSDKQFAIDAYEADKSEILFTLPGALGEMIGPIRRGGYYSIQAGTGVGKSWMGAWVAANSATSGCETAFTPLEMTSEQANLRFQHILLGKCLYKEKNDIIYSPVWDCLHNLTGECLRGYDAIAIKKEVDNQKQSKFNKNKKQKNEYIIPTSNQFDQYKNHTTCTLCMGRPPISSALGFKPSTWYQKIKVDYATPEKSVNLIDVFDKTNQLTAGIHINSFPRETLSVSDYSAYLHNLYHYENILIDVAIPDYANEMKKEKRTEKESIDHIHGGLKSLAQERNIAIISPNQENDDGLAYGSRKSLHLIDGGIRITQTNQEKARGYFKVESLKQRFGKSTKGQVLYVTQCLELGKVVLQEHWDISEE